ncbi:MAG: DUF3368 domain-containing protein [Thermoanaerobaculia bacterium]
MSTLPVPIPDGLPAMLHRTEKELCQEAKLLLAAKLQGRLPDSKTELDRLKGFGFRVSIGLEAAALREAKEP